MNGKLEESILYLKACRNLEVEVFNLYESLSKKINQPESSFILGFAYDSLKSAKTIDAMLDYFDLTEIQNTSSKKEVVELTREVSLFHKIVCRTNSINYEKACESLKELSDMENKMCVVYDSFLQSSLVRVASDEFSNIVIDAKNFKKIFETFIQEKQGHRDTILELIYAIESKEADRLRNATPLVRYSNPDAWIREPAFRTDSVASTPQSAQ